MIKTILSVVLVCGGVGALRYSTLHPDPDAIRESLIAAGVSFFLFSLVAGLKEKFDRLKEFLTEKGGWIGGMGGVLLWSVFAYSEKNIELGFLLFGVLLSFWFCAGMGWLIHLTFSVGARIAPIVGGVGLGVASAFMPPGFQEDAVMAGLHLVWRAAIGVTVGGLVEFLFRTYIGPPFPVEEEISDS